MPVALPVPDPGDWVCFTVGRGKNVTQFRATRSIVVECAHPTMRLALACALDTRNLAAGGYCALEMYMLTMEEDEYADGGFPWLVGIPTREAQSNDHRDKDEVAEDFSLVHTRYRSEVVVHVAARGHLWEARAQLRCGEAALERVPLGPEPGEVTLTVQDPTSSASISLLLHLRPARSSGDSSHSEEDQDTEGEEEGLSEFEDDGFVVMDSDQEEEEDYEGGGEEDADDEDGDLRSEVENDHQHEPCAICGLPTEPNVASNPILLCDGCDDEVHLHCAGLNVVPDGDWYCPTCSGEPAPLRSLASNVPPSRNSRPHTPSQFGDESPSPTLTKRRNRTTSNVASVHRRGHAARDSVSRLLDDSDSDV